MIRPNRWVVIPTVAAVALAASIISASARAPQGGAPAATQETATQKYNREAAGKAPRGPWAYSGASGYTNYLGGGVGRPPGPQHRQHPAQQDENALRSAGDVEVPVARRIHPGRVAGGMHVAGGFRDVAVDEVTRGLEVHHHDQGFQQAYNYKNVKACAFKPSVKNVIR